jgi:non-ribosomal peptide synthetase component F
MSSRSKILALFGAAAAGLSRIAPSFGLNPALSSVIEANYDLDEACRATDWLARDAAERPDVIAHEICPNLSSPPCFLTYAELNIMANKLAPWLRSNGLQLEDRVALCRSRTSSSTLLKRSYSNQGDIMFLCGYI